MSSPAPCAGSRADVMRSSPSGTFQLLHLLCRPSLPGDADARLAALRGPVHWPTVVGKLTQYGGSSWAFAHVVTLDLPVPAAERDRLRQAMRGEVARAMLSADAYKSLAPLTCGGAPDALLIKGRAVEARAYPASVLRPSNDVDLLIRPGRRAAVEDALRRWSWHPVLAGGDGHATLWHGPGRRGAVDLHDAPLSPSRFQGLTPGAVARLFDDAVQLDDGSHALADEAHTALLLAHLHAGVFTDLRHLADAAQWLGAVAPSPQNVAYILNQWGGARCWRAAITALQRWDRAVLPERWRAIPLGWRWHDVTWRPLLRAAWRGSQRGDAEPPLWLRRVALLGHLDAPERYVIGQWRVRSSAVCRAGKARRGQSCAAWLRRDGHLDDHLDR